MEIHPIVQQDISLKGKTVNLLVVLEGNSEKKSAYLILRGSLMSVQTSMSIHPVVVEICQSGSKW